MPGRASCGRREGMARQGKIKEIIDDPTKNP
jgi:hypothetical protein